MTRGAGALSESPSSLDPAEPWGTILLNCACHSFEEVEGALVRRAACGLALARNLAWEAHSQGRALVREGSRRECEGLAAGLREDGLRARAEPL